MQSEVNKEYLDSMLCPSFNSYSTDQLATIADQVRRDHQNDDAFAASQNDDANFEFVALREALDDAVSFNDVVFPVFNRELPREHRSFDSTEASLRLPIFGDGEFRRRSERDSQPPSESSSEADELERIPAATFCLWTPNSPQASPNRCKKSNSTGSTSSKRWKLLDLLRRSNSEGKESFAFLTPPPSPARKRDEVAGKQKKKAFASAHEALYVRNRELRREVKKRSFLPYRPDLVGFCTSRLGKAFPSF